MMALVCAAASATQAVPASKTDDTPAAPTAAPTAEQASDGIVDELHRLLDGHQLTELSTTYNGSYGASLLFRTEKLTYYVALFHNKEFWRVIRTDSYDDARNSYRSFVAQTEQLAKVEVDSIRLQATKQYTDHLVSMNQERLHKLEQDAAYQQQQGRQVAAQQQQAQQQEASLAADLRASSSTLDEVRQHIQALEQQQDNPALGMPASAQNSALVLPSPSPATSTSNARTSSNP